MRTRTLPAGNNLRTQSGFTYLLILAALVVLGITADVISRSEYIRLQHDREQELMFRGWAYQQAIKSYVNARPNAMEYPRQLRDLVSDPRFANKKHLRALYKDPMTGKDWIIIRDKTGAITGVASSSEQKPLKQENFPLGLLSFAGAEHYSDWVFEYRRH